MQNVQDYVAVNEAGRFRKGLMDPFIVSQIDSSAVSLLDLGCGSAQYHQLIAQKNPQIQRFVGIDNSSQMLSKTKNTIKVQYLCMDVTNFSLPEKFQQIIAVFLIEHLNLQNIQNFIRKCKLHLKPKGFLKIFSIDTNALRKSHAYQHSIKYTVECQGELKDGEQFKIKVGKWSNLDTHWSPMFLKSELEKNNFSTQIKYIGQEVLLSQFYQSQEKRQIQQAFCIYCLIAQLDE